jgi:hypothetical protein
VIRRGVILIVVAVAAFAALKLVYGQRPAYVHVRWASSVDATMRTQMEKIYSLTRGELREGTTWGYYVTDVSGANLRAIVENPAVEDTHNIHRTAFRIWRTAPRGDYVTTRPAWIASLLELMTPTCLGLGAILLAVGALRARRARAAQPAPAGS